MGSRFRFLILYYLLWVLFFELMRCVFLLYHFDKTGQISFGTSLATLWYGLKMDLSVAAYILAPVCLFVLLSLVIPLFRKRIIYQVYTFIVLLLVLIVCLVDLEVYNHWGFRMDSTPLKFLSTPREAIASVSHLPLFWIALAFILVFVLLFFLFKRTIHRIFFTEQKKLRLLTALLILLFMGSLIIPIRGGFQLAPLNQSSVYFSTNNYANHAAINVSWNFLHSLLSKGSSRKNPYLYFSDDEMKRITDSLYSSTASNTTVLRDSANNPVNIILVIWESFTEKALHLVIKGREVTPQFNRLKSEGIFFSNVYASGDRTNKGVPAILSGYPAMPNTTIIHSPGKSQKIAVLSKLFAQRGYATPFFYGGEPEFANIKSYLLSGGFHPIVGKDDFSSRDMNSKWGAHDGVVMKRVLNDINKTAQPFFATWLTLTSHEPFETPLEPVFDGKDHTTLFLNSIHYTDQVLGDFVAQCSKQEWWSNTLMMIIGDHGHPLPQSDDRTQDFRTPMLWLGGALKERGVVIDKTVSQLDIAATLSGQVGLDEKSFPFSRNVFDTTQKAWAFFTFNNGFGFVNDSGRLVYDNVGKRPISGEGPGQEARIRAGQAMMQRVYGDFIGK